MKTKTPPKYPPKTGLYDPQNEHDACGVGFVVNINGRKTHKIVEQALEIILNLRHRGAIGGDALTGDGAGLLIPIPHNFFKKVCLKQKIKLPESGEYGVGVFFLPQNERRRLKIEKQINNIVIKEGLKFLGWRTTPTCAQVIGEKARQEQPCIRQCFVSGLSGLELERKLYVVRRVIENKVQKFFDDAEDFYCPSFSSRTLNYKGLFMADQVGPYYPDLKDKDFVSALAVVHQRYSTNTFPTWGRAQPFRYLAHNGEINTLRGNRIRMTAREKSFESKVFGKDIKKLLPIIDEHGSDSGNLDNALELLFLSGRSLAHSMMMLVPEAWGEMYRMGPDERAFFEYHAGLIDPWDGPAALTFTNGVEVGALLDRNGLRPLRYTITRSNCMVMASETGVLDFKPEEVVVKGALGPGEVLLVDTETKRVIYNDEIKIRNARKKPYRRWIEENRISLEGLFDKVTHVDWDEETLLLHQRIFGYTREDINTILAPMAKTGKEPVGSMGHDTPLAVLSEKPQLLYNYFKQLFAQVTNPAIDPIREELVMSTMVFIGNRRNVLTETPQHCRLVKLEHPILRNIDMVRLKSFEIEDFKAVTLPMFFKRNGSGSDLEKSLSELCHAAEKATHDGYTVLILSDRGLNDEQTPIPALLAVAAVNHHLIRLGCRPSVGIVVETGEAREVMHVALLLGYGATAINPYLALETITNMVETGYWPRGMHPQKAVEDYIQAHRQGLMKIMSKMGISTLRSYRGAQVFEAIGLNEDLVDRYFKGTTSQIGGIGLDDIAREANQRVALASDREAFKLGMLDFGGQYAYRKDAERHLFNPQTIMLLQQAVRTDDRQIYNEYASLMNQQEKNLFTLRGLFSFKDRNPVPLDEVEPVENIMKRFVTGAMSFGSISREAHETLAIAMNRIGGKSNSGEGGEDAARYKTLSNGDSKCSAIKQVASGRFGVTANYLSHAQEIQIKISQGAKPGEGGQLPGHKVNQVIARVRNSTPGVSLISPPPHHDIYSIEDLAQLIYDLKCSNLEARISVKLVAESGVGTVAAGVAKGFADMVLISGYDGGTGASPLSSIKHAGMPWELGLAETQQTLMLNGLRDRIRVQVDGQMKTGRDVVVAALLGAEEFGFATAVLVTCGCVMMRKCHQNSCPAGIATQNPGLRKKYNGKPQHVVNYFKFIAEEVRENMARLGFRTFDEMVGRADVIEKNQAIDFWKTRGLDFSKLLANVGEDKNLARRCLKNLTNPAIEQSLDWKILKQSKLALEKRQTVLLNLPIRNTDRTVGTIVSGKIAERYGEEYLPENTLNVNFRGCAGQSFGAFLAKGVTFRLEGEANDYVGKGLSGGRIILTPPKTARFDASQNVIAGNTLLYGATAGEVYIRGRVGGRFAVRNSGAIAVVEGVGEHGCEYMTGGTVVVLGRVGLNFAAGMSGGFAYIYDEKHTLDKNCNLAMIDLDPVETEEDVKSLKNIIQMHYKYTGSLKAKEILNNWEEALYIFVKVFPMEYKRVLGEMMKEDLKTTREEVAVG